MISMLRTLLLAAATSVALADSAVAQRIDLFADDVFFQGDDAVIRRDYETALRLWRPLAEQGDKRAQFKMGGMYANGHGVPENLAEAARWYRLAADQGYSDAQYYLGVMYHEGIGVPENHVDAYLWWSLAAAQGDSVAAEDRATLRRQMTPAEVGMAERLVAAWEPTK